MAMLTRKTAYSIGVAGSSGSGKTTLAVEIVASLNLPWVVILSMVSQCICVKSYCLVKKIQDSFYKVLTPEQHALAAKNEYDFDSPSSIDYDVLVERLEDLKAG